MRKPRAPARGFFFLWIGYAAYAGHFLVMRGLVRKEHHAFFFGVTAAFALTITALLLKLATAIPNETIVFVRFLIAFLFVLPYLLKGKVTITQQQIRIHFVRGVAGLGSIYCLFYSVEKLPLVIAVTLSNTTPLIIPLILFFWVKYVLPKKRMGALLIGFVGVCLILRPGIPVEQGPLMIGLLGSFFAGIAQVGIRVLSKTEPTHTILTYYFLIALVLSFFPMIYAWEPIEFSILWLYLLGIGISSLLFQVCLTKAITHAPVSKVASLSYLSVVFSGVVGWFFLGEVPDWWTVIGTLLIIGGGLFALFSQGESKRRGT